MFFFFKMTTEGMNDDVSEIGFIEFYFLPIFCGSTVCQCFWFLKDDNISRGIGCGPQCAQISRYITFSIFGQLHQKNPNYHLQIAILSRFNIFCYTLKNLAKHFKFGQSREIWSHWLHILGIADTKKNWFLTFSNNFT